MQEINIQSPCSLPGQSATTGGPLHNPRAHPKHRPITPLPLRVSLVVALLDHLAQIAKQPLRPGPGQLAIPPSCQRVKAIYSLGRTVLGPYSGETLKVCPTNDVCLARIPVDKQYCLSFAKSFHNPKWKVVLASQLTGGNPKVINFTTLLHTRGAPQQAPLQKE